MAFTTQVRGWNAIVQSCDCELRRQLRARPAELHHRATALDRSWAWWQVIAARHRFQDARERQPAYAALQGMLRVGREDARMRLLLRVAVAQDGEAARRRGFGALCTRALAVYAVRRDLRRAADHSHAFKLRRGCAGWRAAVAARRQGRVVAATRRTHATQYALRRVWLVHWAAVVRESARLLGVGLRGDLACLGNTWGRLVAGVVWHMRGRRGRTRGATHRRQAARRAGLETWAAWATAARSERADGKRNSAAAAQHHLRRQLRLWGARAEGMTLRAAVRYRALRFATTGALHAWHAQAKLWRRMQNVLSGSVLGLPPAAPAELEVDVSPLVGWSVVDGAALSLQKRSRIERRWLWTGWKAWLRAAARPRDWGRATAAGGAHATRGALRRALGDWRARLRERRAFLVLAGTGPAGGAVRALIRAVRLWRHDAAQRAELERRVRRGRVVRRGDILSALRAWGRFAARRRAIGTSSLMVTRAGAFCERRIARLALRQWVRRRDDLRTAHLQYSSLNLRRTHCRWARVAVRGARKRRRLDAAIKAATRLCLGLRFSFRAWAAEGGARRTDQDVDAARCRAALQLYRGKHMLPAFTAWRRAARRALGVAICVVKGYAQRQQLALQIALDWWAQLTHSAARNGYLLGRAQQETLRLQLARMWRQWAVHRGAAPLLLEAEAFWEARGLAEGWDAWVTWIDQLRYLFHASASGLPSAAEPARPPTTTPAKGLPLEGGRLAAGSQRLPPPGAPRHAWTPFMGLDLLGQLDSSASWPPHGSYRAASYSPGRSPRSLALPGRAPLARPTMRFH